MNEFSRKLGNAFRIFNNYIVTNSRLIIRNVIIFVLLCAIVLIGVSFLVFTIIRQGPPEVAVPMVTEEDLLDGLLILQKKNLGVLIDPRYFSNHEKNIIVEQEPRPGSIVREGKSVKLVVSKGPIISIVEDYTGKTVPFVQNRLQEILSFQGKTVRIGTITSVSSEEPPGTIVGQHPQPNTPITNVEKIDLVVSKGREVQAIKVQDYTGRNVDEVMEMLALRGILVEVLPEDVNDPAQSGVIMAQEPEPGAIVQRNEAITLTVGYLPSEQQEERLYARVLNFDVPAEVEDPESVQVRVEVKDRIGEREIYNQENNAGDSLSIPYKSYSNTTMYIYLDDTLFDIRQVE
jgi:beta-lactam-binding protein with PASTA domain